MEWEEEVHPHYLETLTRLRLYCEKPGPEQNSVDEGLDVEMEEAARAHYNGYSNEQKLLFVYYNRVKLFNAAKSGGLAGGIAERTAQKWVKRLKEDKDWNILEKSN
ncbi:MAG: hypothetical protein EXX96DRAFT_492081 [Benjaminiella poitrasii]|nr:MAG: hypothetical protein EXX96DRAFT_492081 [Benjaminiella poitrasii]